MSITSANNFCSACGNAILDTAVVCPKCGSPTPRYRPESVQIGKSKTTAVVLSVFLGIWSWLYTYRVNGYKFWTTISILLVLFATIIIVAWQAYVAYSYTTEAELMALGRILGPIWQILVVAFWLWALLDNATKPQSFFLSYGKTNQQLKNER